MFRALSKKDLGLVARLAEDYRVPAGQVFVHEGKRESQFYLIVSGKARVTRGRRTVATLGPGEYFGELALLDPGPRNARRAVAGRRGRHRRCEGGQHHDVRTPVPGRPVR